MQIDGIEANGDRTAVRPTLGVGNVNGRITALCLAFEDLLDFKLTMRHTLVRYIDAVNFPAGNPEADPTQELIEVWYLDQKTNEDGETVSWELASPGDVGGESIGRQMTTLCHWCLRAGSKAVRGRRCLESGEGSMKRISRLVAQRRRQEHIHLPPNGLTEPGHGSGSERAQRQVGEEARGVRREGVAPPGTTRHPAEA
jgi:lambda family phage minor tail protein L